MFSRRLWLSGSRAGGTRQSGSPGRGPQLVSQAPWSARTASRSRHRSSGVTQCGWACVPPVTASSATARRRADGGAPAYKIVHASRIASSISRSVTLITNNHPEDPYISENHTRGILWEKLSVAVGFFQFAHYTRQRGKALLGALVAALVKPPPPQN